jgi:hypothetical protein
MLSSYLASKSAIRRHSLSLLRSGDRYEEIIQDAEAII